MKALKTLVVALSVTLWLPMVAQAAEESAPSAEEQTPPAADATASAKCLEAVVNPVTGYAICTNPRGAPVNETWTVYEHASGYGTRLCPQLRRQIRVPQGETMLRLPPEWCPDSSTLLVQQRVVEWRVSFDCDEVQLKNARRPIRSRQRLLGLRS